MTKYQAGRIDQLRKFADNFNLLVTFRDKKTNAGDFTIFIYRPEESRYAVGFDGYWSDYNELSFESCIYQAFKWINEEVHNNLIKETVELNQEKLVNSIETILKDYGVEYDTHGGALEIYGAVKEILG